MNDIHGHRVEIVTYSAWSPSPLPLEGRARKSKHPGELKVEIDLPPGAVCDPDALIGNDAALLLRAQAGLVEVLPAHVLEARRAGETLIVVVDAPEPARPGAASYDEPEPYSTPGLARLTAFRNKLIDPPRDLRVQLVDISHRTCRFDTHVSLREGFVIRLKFDLPDGTHVALPGIVRGTLPLDRGGYRCHAGLLPAEGLDQHYLRRFLLERFFGSRVPLRINL